MNRKKAYLLIILLVCIGYLIFVFQYKKMETEQLILPVPNIKAHIDSYSAHNIKLKQTRIKQKKQAETEEGKASLSKYWNKMVSIQSSAIQSVQFYARVVDQYNQPVTDALVKYKASGTYLATGSGFGSVTTDADGFFNLNTAKGASFYITNIQNQGYDFHTISKGFEWVTFEATKRGPDSKVWSDYTQAKPYLFKAWKIEHNDKLISLYHRNYYFHPEQLYSVVLDTEERRYFKGEGKGSFELLFTRSEKSWQLKLMAPQGGFIESDDLYMNLAPEDGYQETITIAGEFSYSAKVNKQFYLKTSKGLYAKLILDVSPYFNKKKASIWLDYTINLDGNRNLAIVDDRENEIAW